MTLVLIPVAFASPLLTALPAPSRFLTRPQLLIRMLPPSRRRDIPRVHHPCLRAFPCRGATGRACVPFPVAWCAHVRRATTPSWAGPVRLTYDRDGLLEGFVRDVAVRLAQRLLSLAHQLGQRDPCSLRIVQKIAPADLAEMVGTTRPRIGALRQRIRDLGLIERTIEHQLILGVVARFGGKASGRAILNG